MKRSIVRLIATSVLVFWVVGFGVLLVYATTRAWDEPLAKQQGLYWAFRTLDEASPDERPELLESMQGHFGADLAIVPVAAAEEAMGASATAGKSYFVRDEPSVQWLYIPLHDSSGVFAAGPFDPTEAPQGHSPVGLFLAILFTPLIASLVALRLSRQLHKVERASEAIGSGVLSARVDNTDGPTHELAASFNAMAANVERLVKERDELVQAVSHELGSPLSRLRFQLELLEGDLGDADRRTRLDAMAREIDELNELVEELLGWVQADRTTLRRRPFDPVKPLMDLVDLCQLHAPEGSEMTVDTELPTNATIDADPKLFQRAIENLLRNAMRYGTSKALVSMEEGEAYVKVMVDDDGAGIPIEERERVLEPFVRIEADRDRETGGVGLGLAIVNRIVRSHGGAIGVEAAPLGGARIVTTWPRA